MNVRSIILRAVRAASRRLTSSPNAGILTEGARSGGDMLRTALRTGGPHWLEQYFRYRVERALPK